MPSSKPPPSPLAVDQTIDLERRAEGAVGVVGDDLRRAEHGHQPVALELVDVAALGRDHRHHDLEELVETGDHLLRVCGLGEAAEVLDVAEEDRDVDDLALLGEALAEDVVGDLVVEVGAEGLADPLALAQAADHLVERSGELADLVGGGDRNGDVEVALGNARRSPSAGRPGDPESTSTGGS